MSFFYRSLILLLLIPVTAAFPTMSPKRQAKDPLPDTDCNTHSASSPQHEPALEALDETPPFEGVPLLDTKEIKAFWLQTFITLKCSVQTAPPQDAIEKPSDYKTSDLDAEIGRKAGVLCHEKPFEKVL